MAKKKKGGSFTKKMPINLVKKYASFAHCGQCEEEQQVKRAMIVGGDMGGKRKVWLCLKCTCTLPAGTRPTTKAI